MRAFLILFMLTLGGAPVAAQAPKNPKELGRVRWHRDLDAGLAEAKKTGKPVFLQFQEVPG